MGIINKVDVIDLNIERSSHVFIMGHKHIDLDALGAMLGIYEYVNSLKKKATLIINDTVFESGVKRALIEIENKYIIKKSSKVKNSIDENSLLIVVDTNRTELFQDPTLCDKISNILIIDHHDETDKTSDKAILVLDEDSSSACEMIGELLEFKNVKISAIAANLLLSGIFLDTNNFVLNTTHKTFKVSTFLTLNKADPNFVQYLLKQNIKKYFKRQAILTNVKIYGNIAITFAKSDQIYRREDLARVAATLIQFNKIEAAFVIGKIEKNRIGISAKSLGDIKVSKILEEFDGGGTEHNAGASVENSQIKEVKLELLKHIKNYK